MRFMVPRRCTAFLFQSVSKYFKSEKNMIYYNNIKHIFVSACVMRCHDISDIKVDKLVDK